MNACERCGDPSAIPSAAAGTAPPGCHWYCDTCASRPVVCRQDVVELYRLVEAFLKDRLALDLGAWLKPEDVRLSRAASLPGPGRQAATLGRARYLERRVPLLGLRWIDDVEVQLLEKLPFLQAGAVLAHEAFHVYSAKENLRFDALMEEGSANLWAYLLLAMYPGRISWQYRHELLASSDPLYGDGFRAARTNYKRATGFRAYLAACATNP